MLPLSNYYNIGSESYFLNVPLFNYKVIFKYSYFLIPSILCYSLCHLPYYLTGNVFWRFPFVSKSVSFLLVFFPKSSIYPITFFSHNFSRQKWMVWLLQPCNQASLSLLCFLQALMSRAQQTHPREQQHSGLCNVPLLPPQLHKFSSLTNLFLPVFLSIFPLFFSLPIHLFSSPVLIFLVLQVCWMCPLKERFIHSRACRFLKAQDLLLRLNFLSFQVPLIHTGTSGCPWLSLL